MPGLLKKTARCPECGDPLLALADLTRPRPQTFQRWTVVRTYYHQRKPRAKRRRRPCVARFTSLEIAQAARRLLEV